MSSFVDFFNKHIKNRGDIIKLFKAVAILTIFSVITRMLGFVFKIFLSRTLTTEMLGIYSIVVSIFMVFVTILTSGIPLAVSKTTIINKDKPSKANGSVTSALIISTIISIVIALLILVCKQLFVGYFGNTHAYILLLLMTPAIIFTGIYSPFKGYLWGKEKFTEVSLVEFIEQIIRLGCYFICFYLLQPNNILYPAGISLSVACILSTILGIILFFKSKGRLTSPKSCFKPIFRSATPITCVRLATSLMQPFMAFLLPIMLVKAGFTNEQALSQLGIAMGMTLPFLSIPSTLIGSLAMAIVPNLTDLYNTKNYSALKKQITYAINFTLCCSFIAIPCFVALGEPLCQLIFDNITAGTYLKHISWMIVPMGLSQITTSMLNSLNLESKTFRYYLYSCVVSILCVIILPKYIGVYALMYAIGLSMLLISILNLITINKTIKSNKTYLGIILKLVVISIPCIYFTNWLYNLILYVFGNFVSIVISGGISIIIFTIMMSVFNIVDITYLSVMYKTKVKTNKKCTT